MKKLLVALFFSPHLFSQTDATPFGFPNSVNKFDVQHHYISLNLGYFAYYQENLKTADSLARIEINSMMLAVDSYILKHQEKTREAYLVSIRTPEWYFRVYFYRERKEWHSWTFSVPVGLSVPSHGFKRWILDNTLTVNQIEEIIGFEISNCDDGFDEIDLQIDDNFTLDGFEPENYF